MPSYRSPSNVFCFDALTILIPSNFFVEFLFLIGWVLS